MFYRWGFYLSVKTDKEKRGIHDFCSVIESIFFCLSISFSLPLLSSPSARPCPPFTPLFPLKSLFVFFF